MSESVCDSNVENLLPSVVVLLAAYNGITYIEQQLQSILQQKNVNVTVFISVDLSSDNTYEWCLSFAKQYLNINVLPYGERFGSAAPNFFRLIKDVNFLNFDYLAFSDQDDVWFLDKLSHGIKQMEIANAEAYSASVIAFWEDGTERLIDKSQPQREFDYLFEAAGPGCTYIYTHKAASLIKEYLNTFPELNDFVLHDWLAYAILRHKNYIWFIDSVPKMYYRQHDLNQVGANFSFKGKVSRMYYILSGQAFGSIKLLANVLEIPSIQMTSRMGVFKLALKARQLRRRRIERFLAFIALISYAILGPHR